MLTFKLLVNINVALAQINLVNDLHRGEQKFQGKNLGLVTKPLAWCPYIWSPCLRHGLHACGMLPMPTAWSPCLRQGPHACGMVSMPAAWFPCLRHGFHASRNTPLLLLTYFAFLAFFVFFAFFATLTL